MRTVQRLSPGFGEAQAKIRPPLPRCELVPRVFGHGLTYAALLGIARKPWQNLRLFRAWVHSQRDAMVDGGGVTLPALRGLAESYSSSDQDATG